MTLTTLRKAFFAGGVSAALAISLVAAAPAEACGGFFSQTNTSDVAVMSDIRVLLVKHPQSVDQYVQVGYRGGRSDLAWIYPVAANPQIEEVQDDLFGQLEQGTRPTIDIVTPDYSSGGGGFGCGGASDGAKGPSARQVEGPPVKVWQQGQVGSFDYVVLSASHASDLLAWLDTNGFAVPASTESVAQRYLSLGWVFVAMKLSVTAVTSDVPSTTTIRLSYAADEVRYPLAMVSLSAPEKTSIELYLLTTESAVELSPEAPFSALAIDAEALKATSSSTHNYEAVFEQTLEAAGPRGFVIEYASPHWVQAGISVPDVQEGMLTRLRGELGREVLDGDIVFSLRAPQPLHPHYTLIYEETQQAGAPIGLLLLALLWHLSRRMRASRA